MSEKRSGVYQIRNTVNSKVYIGSAVNISRRFKEHKKHLRGAYHINKKLQRAWAKYGEEAFEFSVIELCTKEQLIQFEQFYMDRHGSVRKGYNVHPNARNSLGRKVSQATRDKISKALTGRRLSQEQKRAISDGGKGLKRSLATRLKMSLSFSGRAKTPEHRAKLSAANTGKTLSSEHVENAARGLRKPYLCESVDGDIFLVVNIKLFCCDKSIISQLMCKIAREYENGTRKTHKEWKCRGLSVRESQLIKPYFDELHSYGWVSIPKLPDGVWSSRLPESFVSEQAGCTASTAAPHTFIAGMGKSEDTLKAVS